MLNDTENNFQKLIRPDFPEQEKLFEIVRQKDEFKLKLLCSKHNIKEKNLKNLLMMLDDKFKESNFDINKHNMDWYDPSLNELPSSEHWGK
ncbi:MAG: hypothetical protein U9Q69_05065 [Nanoarchaeota archaeon]|nr:hypothetical protein [Nanoarchaeota archaeon]